MTDWLFTNENFTGGAYRIGRPYRLWSWAPRDHRTGDVRLRRDGQPWTPTWRPGDTVVMYHSDIGRCVARLKITGNPVWKASENRFYTDTTVLAANQRGPTLALVGIRTALQGGRHRITQRQARVARQIFAGERPDPPADLAVSTQRPSRQPSAIGGRGWQSQRGTLRADRGARAAARRERRGSRRA